MTRIHLFSQVGPLSRKQFSSFFFFFLFLLFSVCVFYLISSLDINCIANFSSLPRRRQLFQRQTNPHLTTNNVEPRKSSNPGGISTRLQEQMGFSVILNNLESYITPPPHPTPTHTHRHKRARAQSAIKKHPSGWTLSRVCVP